jgi:hypothetical protein
MKLERRIARLEAEAARLEEKRQALLADHLALRAAFIALVPVISAASTARYDEAKSTALLQVEMELTALAFRPDTIAEATAAVEEVFSALAAAHGARDRPQPMYS